MTRRQSSLSAHQLTCTVRYALLLAETSVEFWPMGDLCAPWSAMLSGAEECGSGQDMGMLGHSLDGLPWDGGAMPFYDDDEDMKMVHDMGQDINNRVGGGAGKRLSLAELQVCGF